MNKFLILKAFEKARIKKKNEGNKKPSLTDLSEELSNFIDEKQDFKLGERSFRDYFNDAKKLENEKEDISIKQIAVINGLCKYLGFNDYSDFLASIKNEKEDSKLRSVSILVKKNKILISILTITFIVIMTYTYVTRQRWMIWQKDHYIEVKFDAEKYNLNQLKLFKKDRIIFFRKVEVTCDTIFFNKDNTPRFWYGKNNRKELEYFTSIGLHPETGKTLKPITQYMIDKYICKN